MIKYKKVIILIIGLCPLFSLSQTNVFPNSGNVGIGFNYPVWKLTVNGTVAVNGDGNQVLHIRPNSSYDGLLYWAENGVAERGVLGFKSGSGDLIYRSGANNMQTGYERFRIKADGNVGIGTSSPTSLLQVAGEGSFRNDILNSGYLSINAGGSTTQGYINWWKPGNVRVGYMGYNDGVTANNLALTLEANASFIISGGRVGVGTNAPDEKLTVKGKIHAEEVKVDLTVPGPDYVFNYDYQLTPLSEIQSYIKTNKHLPEVPSAKEMGAKGINLSEMSMLLLKKVEELTLYIINQSQDISILKKENKVFKEEIEKLKKD